VDVTGVALVVTVDVEADDQWGDGRRQTLRNLASLPRLAQLLSRHRVPATFLTSYEVAADPDGRARLAEVAAQGAEVGAHFHPWTVPPDDPACPPGRRGEHPFPSSLSEELFAAKFETLHRTLAEAFGRPPTAYRAGRLGVHGPTVRALEAHGYVADTSVVPLSDWSGYVDTTGGRGPCFVHAPRRPYRPDREDPTHPGEAQLLEVPVTVCVPPRARALGGLLPGVMRRGPVRAGLRRGLGLVGALPRVLRVFPRTRVEELLACARSAREDGAQVLVTYFHSSELFPGTSPYNPGAREVDAFFDKLDGLLAGLCAAGAQGRTLSDYARAALAQQEGRDAR